jgi:hypothetical protein
MQLSPPEQTAASANGYTAFMSVLALVSTVLLDDAETFPPIAPSIA